MRTRFPRGSTAYAVKDGRSYIVEECADGMVYCTTESGGELDFPESALLNEEEWRAKRKGQAAASSGGKGRDVSYQRIEKARHYLPAADKANPAAAEQMLVKAQRLAPSLLDFVAFTVAARILTEHKEQDLIGQLSVRKCRAIFNAAPPATRARLVAELLGARLDALVSAGGLGDNVLKAMIAKGLELHAVAFEDFEDRPAR
jgi:hypothetical protein